jgi:hypothetical protein
MKQIKVTYRVLKKYENTHNESLYCSKCGRKINENEYVSRTTHHIRYYCSDCSKRIEI